MNRVELVKQLDLISPALADNNLVPIFTCYTFEHNIVYASSDSLTILAPSEPTGQKMPFAVAGVTLRELLKNSGGTDVKFNIIKDTLVVETGKSTFKLPYFGATDLIFREPVEEKWAVKVPINEDLLRGISICLTTTSRDNSMPAIMGVCFSDINIFSCDGDAITRVATKFITKGVYTVSNQFCDALLKICNETETTEGTLEINNNWAKATLKNGFIIYGRIIENDNPLDHATLIKDTMKGEGKFVPLPEGFDEALSRARVLADLESKPTTLVVEGNKLKLITDTILGEAIDVLGIKGHPPVQASVHASLVQRSIKVCDQISIRTNCTCYRLGDTVLQVVSNLGE